MSGYLLVRSVLGAGLVVGTLATGAAADDADKVVVTIRPIQSLVAGVMAGVGEPILLIPGGASPHAYALRPSQARALNRARVVVRVSRGLETFLERPIANLAGKAHVLTLDETPGLTLYEPREGGLWEAHDHDEHARASQTDDHDHDKHGHDKHDHDHDKHEKHEAAETGHDHDKHGHEKRDKHDHDHDKHEKHETADTKHKQERHEDHEHAEHAHGEHDPHLWLDPENAKKLTTRIADVLSKAWPAHTATFRANAERQRARLQQLDTDLRTATKGLSGKPYIVFHDAYRYFEQRYGLQPAGAISVSADRPPGARRLLDIRKRIQEAKAICVFAEPQFEPKLVDALVEKTQARRATLDPLGADVAAGPDHYFTLMRNLAAALAGCLSPPTQ